MPDYGPSRARLPDDAVLGEEGMQFRNWIRQIALVVACTAVGCQESSRPLRYLGNSPLQYYRDVSTYVAFANVDEPTPDAITFSQAPRQVGKLSDQETWNLNLAETIALALKNNEVIRRNGGVIDDPDFTQSVYDPSIQASDTLFGVSGSGQRGVEDALSDFDTQFSTNILWGRNEQIQNNIFESGGLGRGETLKDETANFQARLDKIFAQGGQFGIVHNMNYSGNNLSTRLFPSLYTGSLRAEYRQPLMAGSGSEYNRVAGPLNQNVGLNRGVLIARINNDISIADFESRTHDLVKEVEDAYWDLYLSYQIFHNETLARNSALRNWRRVESENRVGRAGASAEAQARSNYFDSRSRVENSLADVYANEQRLRRLLGLTVNDGKMIRPSSEPTTAEFTSDWHISLAEALTRRIELRRQKWRIKRLQLQLRAASNLARPQVDFVSNYQVNAFGDRLFSNNDNDDATDALGAPIPTQGLRSAYETMTQGNQTGWNLGVEVRMNLGLRSEMSQIRNIELRLAKNRAYLAAKEIDIGHEIAQSFQRIARNYSTAQSNLNRQLAAEQQVKSVEEESRLRESTPEAVDLLLRAHLALRDARLAYFASVVEFNKGITDLHYRKGTLLELNNVHIAEGMWEPGAYEDALRRAWARSYGIPANHVHSETEPLENYGAEEIELFIPRDDSEPGHLPPQPTANDADTEPLNPEPPAPAAPERQPVPEPTDQEAAAPAAAAGNSGRTAIESTVESGAVAELADEAERFLEPTTQAPPAASPAPQSPSSATEPDAAVFEIPRTPWDTAEDPSS